MATALAGDRTDRDRVQSVPAPGSADEPQKSPRGVHWRRDRVTGLVEAELDPAGEGDGRQQPPALVADLPHRLDSLALEGGHGGGDVVAEQVQFGAATFLGWVDGELGRWQGEDQPAAAGVDRPVLRTVARAARVASASSL